MSELSKAQKEALVQKRIEAARKRNEAIERRRAEIVAEKKILGVAAQAPKLVLDDEEAGGTGSHWTAPKFKDEWGTRGEDIEFESRPRGNPRSPPRDHQHTGGQTEGHRGQGEGHRGRGESYGGYNESQGNRSENYRGRGDGHRSHGDGYGGHKGHDEGQRRDQTSQHHSRLGDGNDRSHRHEQRQPPSRSGFGGGDLRNKLKSTSQQQPQGGFGTNSSFNPGFTNNEEDWGSVNILTSTSPAAPVSKHPAASTGNPTSVFPQTKQPNRVPSNLAEDNGVLMRGVASIKGSTPGGRGRGRGRGRGVTSNRPVVPQSSPAREGGLDRVTEAGGLLVATQSLTIQPGKSTDVIDLTQHSPPHINSTAAFSRTNPEPVHHHDVTTAHSDYSTGEQDELDIILIEDEDDVTPIPSRESTPARPHLSKDSTPIPEGTNRIPNRTKSARQSQQADQPANHREDADQSANPQPVSKIPVSNALHIDIRDSIEPTIFSPIEDERPDYLRTPEGGWSSDWSTVVETLEGM